MKIDRTKYPYEYCFNIIDNIQRLREFMIHDEGYILSNIITKEGKYYIYTDASEKVIKMACSILNIDYENR